MIVLVLGGTRSGKSVFAERLASRTTASVQYVATAHADPADLDHTARIAAHRDRRPVGWRTHECQPQAVVDRLRALEGLVLLDALGSWVSQHEDFAADVESLVAAIVERDGDTIVVSDEVGLAVHAPTEVGRRFADALGRCNQLVAAIADHVVLVVAGRAVELDTFDTVWESLGS